MSAYREPCPPKPRSRDGTRCCGMCDAAVGGCIQRVTFPARDGWGRKIDVPAGRSSHFRSTPPMVIRNGVWTLEKTEESQ